MQSFLVLAVCMSIIYFFMIRPQQKQQQERNNMLASLQNGDEVITVAGTYGTILDIDEEKINLKISENVTIQVVRSAIGQIVELEDDEDIDE